MSKSILSPAVASATSTTQPPSPAIPQTGFLRQPQVLVFVPISRSTLWRRVQAGTFPVPIKLSARVTAWRAEDLRRWIAEQSLSHDSTGAGAGRW